MGGTRKHAQVDDKSSETNMEIDLSEVGTKGEHGLHCLN